VVLITPDEKFVITGSKDSNIRVFDRITAKESFILKGH
jgi:hypothetical protein